MILFDFPNIPSVHCVFGSRSIDGMDDGDIAFNHNSQAGQNRLALLNRLRPMGLSTWAECQQVHGCAALVEPEAIADVSKPGQYPEADAMMTSQPGLGLLIKTADCQSILFTDSKGQHVMAIHAGWRGNRQNFPGKAVELFCAQFQLQPESVFAVRGPSLGPDNAEFTNFDQEWGAEFAKWRNGDNVDLWAMTDSQLIAAGVQATHIWHLDICTYANFEHFYSYRKDNNTGRQASLIWIASGAAS